MFTRNELIELFRGIVYYTNDPSTFRNIALTCKDFAKICHEYNPMKKNEFRVEKDMKLYNESFKGRFLPNGHRHEIIFIYDESENNKYDRYYVCNNGNNKIYRSDINSLLKGGSSMIYKDSYYYISRDNHDRRFIVEKISKNHKSIVNFTICELCNKYHNFSLRTVDRCMDIEFIFQFDCLNSKIYSLLADPSIGWSRYRGFHHSVVEALERRNRIIKSVITYAKMLKK